MSRSQNPENNQDSIARKLQAIASVAGKGRASGEMARTERFPPWAAPLIGAVVGGGLAARFFGKGNIGAETGATLASVIAIGAVVGFAAGMIIWFLDRPASPRGRSGTTPDFPLASDGAQVLVMDDGVPLGAQPELSLLGKFCTLLAIVLCWIPMAGLVLAIPAFFAHRNAGKKMGLPLTGGLVVSVLATTLFFIAMAFAPRR